MSEKKMRAWLEKVQYHIEDYDLAMEVRAVLAEPMVDDFQRGVRAMRDAIIDRFMCPPYDGCNDGRQPDECDDCKFAGIVIDMPTPEDK